MRELVFGVDRFIFWLYMDFSGLGISKDNLPKSIFKPASLVA